MNMESWVFSVIKLKETRTKKRPNNTDIHLLVDVKSAVTDIMSVLKDISRAVKNLCLIKKPNPYKLCQIISGLK